MSEMLANVRKISAIPMTTGHFLKKINKKRPWEVMQRLLDSRLGDLGSRKK